MLGGITASSNQAIRSFSVTSGACTDNRLQTYDTAQDQPYYVFFFFLVLFLLPLNLP